MTRSKLTDEAVSALPLHDGRVELLEEIMASPVVDRSIRTDPDRPRHTQRWVASIAAAAAIIAVAAIPLWLTRVDDPAAEQEAPFASIVEGMGERALLTTAGWTVEHVSESEYGGEISYVNGDKSLQVVWYPADQYQSYVTDRQHINHPEVDPGEAVDVLGAASRMWAYTSHDHTVILPPGDTFFLEVRADGMDKQAFVAILGDLQHVDRAGLEAALPSRFVTKAERSAAIAEILDEIGELPPGLKASDVTSTEPDRYHLGADVSGAVACGWIAEFGRAKDAGNESRMTAAMDALQGSKQWPILLEMDERGDYPDVVWDYADAVAAGSVPEGYRQGLGC
jgi:hypothetical protein